MAVRRLGGIALATGLLTGCSVSPGLIGPLPAASDKDNAAKIIVIRESRFTGSMQTLPVTLDGVRIYGLGSGEHVVMAVNPGDHIVGTQYPMIIPPSWEDVNVLVRTEPRQSYYFRIDPMGGPLIVNPIDPEAGRMLMSKTTRIFPPPE
jgi:hypothetical protein